MSRTDVLDIPRPAPRRMDDLQARRTRGGTHRPHIRGYEPSLGPRLVRNLSNHEQRISRSTTRRRDQG